jgi:hypothetical protein
MNIDCFLELSSPELRALIAEANEVIVRHVESLPQQPSTHIEVGADLARSLGERLPKPRSTGNGSF